ncbi:hypothetical protein [Roseisolibacter agri]|uniref:Uncharacterized protein n=1 Tax=Roseisolibacter agri TaxID=2014610 RepID=A0AA37V0P8_9BACT|nr:hypothetical protein [Roseisolibacter agri]GLC24940.1 hypothetical protein rosag_14530 [Roseisolibacter agri]
MDASVARQLRFLRAYTLVSTTLLLVLGLAAFTRAGQPAKQRFTEIDVERINVVEPDGKLRMVISNRPRSIGPIYKGKPFGYAGGTRPGIIFFNDEGTENGGLTFTGRRGPDGKFQSSVGMSFDQYNQDQVLYLQYADQNGQRRMGFTVADRADVDIYDLVAERDSIMKLPEGAARTEALRRWQEPRDGQPLFAQRVYVGRDVAKSALVNLSDRSGKPRVRLVVDSLGRASLDFLDETGRVTYSLPDSGRRSR